MAADVKFSVKAAVENQALVNVTVSEELEKRFIKKSRSAAWKLIPASIVVSVIVIAIIVLLAHFLRRIFFSLAAILFIFFPIYAVYNVFATYKAIKNHDYEFLSGTVNGKNEHGYQVSGLEGHDISPFIGRKEYGPGERVIVARLNDELNIISETE